MFTPDHPLAALTERAFCIFSKGTFLVGSHNPTLAAFRRHGFRQYLHSNATCVAPEVGCRALRLYTSSFQWKARSKRLTRRNCQSMHVVIDWCLHCIKLSGHHTSRQHFRHTCGWRVQRFLHSRKCAQQSGPSDNMDELVVFAFNEVTHHRYRPRSLLLRWCWNT